MSRGGKQSSAVAVELLTAVVLAFLCYNSGGDDQVEKNKKIKNIRLQPGQQQRTKTEERPSHKAKSKCRGAIFNC